MYEQIVIVGAGQAAVQTVDIKRMDWLVAHPPAPANAQPQRTGARD